MLYNKSIIKSQLIFRIISLMSLLMGFFMLLPCLFSFIKEETAWIPLLVSSLCSISIGLLFRLFIEKKNYYTLQQKDGYLIVGIVWLFIPLIGTLPYLLSGTIASFTDAFFESMSGFTATGASILPDVEAIPEGVLIWRSLTQWIGGLGLLIFTISLIRKVKEGKNFLFLTEFSVIVNKKIHPNASKSSNRLLLLYSMITLCMICLLLLAGNKPLHALCLALSTVSTGGFSPVNDNLSFFSESTQNIIMVFMFLSGINLIVLYHLSTGKLKKAIQNQEFRWYIGLILLFSLLLFLIIAYKSNMQWFESARHSLFVVLSTLSTTGYYLKDLNNQGLHVLLVVFVLMFIGGCTGSVTGSIKVARIVCLFKYAQSQFKRLAHPNAIIQVKMENQTIRPEKLNFIFTFCFLYGLFFLGGSMILCLGGMELPSAASVSASILGNIGNAIGSLCADCSLIGLPQITKWLLSLLMLAGRLEILALIALFSKEFWKK